MDANRIASSDAVVIHKAVLALLTVVAQLESRINALETAAAAAGEFEGAGVEDTV
jgi:hypothetical protein